MIELLAPAGDYERLKFALLYGADAVYFAGYKYGLRANATNFSPEELKKAVEYAHSLRKKVYITVNIVFHDEDIEGLDDYLVYLDKIGVDAIILSDPIVIERVKALNLKLQMHLSTQASTLNSRAVKHYTAEGISRFVLAREASKKDISRIKKETHAEIECFIQGAMCTSFSGRCVLSNYATNRDANRGGCAQICRWSFDANEKEEFEMMPKDLNMSLFISDMINIGVNSFKIEGRMRSIYYIATILYIYKSIFDKIRTNSLTDEYIKYATNIINRVANRESVCQFYLNVPTYKEQYYNGRKEESNQDFLGLVDSYEDGYIALEVRNYFKVGDKVQIFGPGMEEIEFEIKEIFNERGEAIEVCNHPKELVKIKCPYKCVKDAMMRVKVFDKYSGL